MKWTDNKYAHLFCCLCYALSPSPQIMPLFIYLFALGGKGVMLNDMPSLKVAELLLLLLTSHLAAAIYQPPSKASPSAVDHR